MAAATVTLFLVRQANSPLVTAQRGVQRYRDVGVNISKLVLGIPWCAFVVRCSTPVRYHGIAGLKSQKDE